MLLSDQKVSEKLIVPWYIIPLYTLGEEHTDLTGGWVPGYSAGNGNQAKNDDHLYR